jgi:hypothetical protein
MLPTFRTLIWGREAIMNLLAKQADDEQVVRPQVENLAHRTQFFLKFGNIHNASLVFRDRVLGGATVRLTLQV